MLTLNEHAVIWPLFYPHDPFVLTSLTMMSYFLTGYLQTHKFPDGPGIAGVFGILIFEIALWLVFAQLVCVIPF